MPSRPRPSQLGLAAATLLLCLLGIDRLLATALPLGAIIYRTDDESLYAYRAGAAKIFIHSAANGGAWVRTRINDAGYRGAPLRPAGEALRVVVFGDSFVAAEFSPLEESFVAQLGEALGEQAARPVEVVNAGLVGAGPDQVLRRLPREVPALSPALVVVAITAANDFGDLVRNKLYSLERDGALLPRRARLSPALEDALSPGWLARSGWVGLLRAAARGAHERFGPGGARPPPRLEARTLLAQARYEHEQWMLRREPIVRNLFSDAYDADVALEPSSRSARDKRALMAAVLRELDTALEGLGVPWLLVVIPSPVDTSEDHYGLPIDPARYPEYRREALTQAVAQPARSQAIAVVDLFETLSGPEAASFYYRAGNDHWNARGQARAARVVAERIGAEGWLTDREF